MSTASSDSQRRRYALQADYPPAAEGGPTRRRYLPCLTCRSYATRGCVRDGHLIGEAEDVLPALTLRPGGSR